MYALSFGCVTINGSLVSVTAGHVERKKNARYKYSIYLITQNKI